MGRSNTLRDMIIPPFFMKEREDLLWLTSSLYEEGCTGRSNTLRDMIVSFFFMKEREDLLWLTSSL